MNRCETAQFNLPTRVWHHVRVGEFFPNGEGRHTPVDIKNKKREEKKSLKQERNKNEAADPQRTKPRLVEPSPFETSEMLRARLRQLREQQHAHPTPGAAAEIAFIKYQLGEE